MTPDVRLRLDEILNFQSLDRRTWRNPTALRVRCKPEVLGWTYSFAYSKAYVVHIANRPYYIGLGLGLDEFHGRFATIL